MNRRPREHERSEKTAPNVRAKAILVAMLAIIVASLLSDPSFGQDSKVCTITRDAPLIKAFLSEDYDALTKAGMKAEAAKDVRCMVAKGTKVVIMDSGAPYVTAHVVSGPQDGCVGNLTRKFYSCSAHQ
ncbi:MAG: hypothetical protein ACYDC3_00210 [Candidatus Binataceae bacterium]